MNEQRKNPYRRPPRQTTGEPTRSEPTAGRNPSREPVQGGRKGIRRLPSEFQDLADGRIDRLSRPRPRPNPLDDEREGAVIPGVRNTEARAVYDSRVTALRAALAAGQDRELAEGLRVVQELTLWRARSVTDFQAFAESVVGVPAARIQDLAALPVEALPAHAVALVIRIEAALLQRPPGGRVQLQRDEHGLQLELRMNVDDVARSVEALSDVGHAVAGLRRFLRPDSIPAERERPQHAPDDARRSQGRHVQADARWQKDTRGRRTHDRPSRETNDRQSAGRDRLRRKPPARGR